jgi:hypothetical protein
MDPITPTAEELKQLADRRARKARTAAKNAAKGITDGLAKVEANRAKGKTDLIRSGGYAFVPMDDGTVRVFRKGLAVPQSAIDAAVAAVAAACSGPAAPPVETTGAADPAAVADAVTA